VSDVQIAVGIWPGNGNVNEFRHGGMDLLSSSP